MMDAKKISVAVLGAALALAVPMHASAVSEIAGATFPEQIVQEGTAVEQLARAAEQVQNQLQMLQNEARNLTSLSPQFESQLMGEVSHLTQIVGQGQALSYAGQNITAQFQQEYPGAANATQNFGQYSQDYQSWNTTTNQNIENALNAQHLSAQQFATEDQAVQSAISASQSATGRMQVLQAANQIAGIEVKQLQQLQSITMADDDAQMAYLKQKKAQANATSQMAADGLLSGGSNTILP